jgi:hypothetical protein
MSLLKIAVVAHDAGASEILVAFIKEHLEQAKWTLYAPYGSAFESIAQREGLPTQGALDLYGFDALFFGTGWQEKIESEFVKEAKRSGIPSFAFLDHWSSYRERFGYPDERWRRNLPNYVIVSDEKAEQLAKQFALAEVLRVNNFYLHKQIRHAFEEEVTASDNLLFLSEPTDQVALSTYKDSNYWGFTQYSALEEVLKNFEKFECRGLHIRLHPAEKQHAYAKVLKKFPHIKSQIYPAAFYPLEKDLLRAKVIIGFDTMALYTAALLNKPVISYLPSNNREFFLPLPVSHQLRNLDKLNPRHLTPLALELESNGMAFAFILEQIKGFYK